MGKRDSTLISALKFHLRDLYGFSSIDEVQLIYSRYRCLNYIIRVEGGSTFFLKRYAGRTGEEVFETKVAERFFYDHETPIILPLLDKHGRPAFFLDNDWFSLFPYIDQEQSGAPLSEVFLESLGMHLGRMHAAGRTFENDSFRRLKMWNKEQFNFKYVAIRELLQQSEISSENRRVLEEGSRKKKMFVDNDNHAPEDFQLKFDTLLHGDPIYQNAFIDEQGQVSKIFDLEEVCIGPASFELGRALMINCFEKGWGTQEKVLAKVFLKAYLGQSPMEPEEVKKGLEVYLIKNAYKLWFEHKLLTEPTKSLWEVYEAHIRRLDLLSGDLKDFVRSIYP
ncbi:MAG: phosphotransferase [bacterium]|jgi:Ser/Thr protein kinase RdoA (MazF antagonist)|nr:phosphotransferase [bacterium]